MKTFPLASPGEFVMSAPPPLSLYIHIPWCVRKCPYCDFNSHEARGSVPEAEYVSALVKDLKTALPLVWGRKVVSVFFGGGTPSLLSARAVDEILTAVRTLLPLEPLAEITLEANPGTAEAQKFADFRSAGVNRLSLGIQSFNAKHLQLLGRIHDGIEARRAVDLAQRHFDNINLDLMYALPEQGMDEMLADLSTAIAFGPQHLSAYHLTLEPNTRFFLDPPELPDDDLAAEMQEAVESELADAGYEHYETSGFAQKNRRCKHNLNYWLFGDYLGIGAGAHGKLTLHDGVLRQMRYKQPKAYLEHALKGAPVHEEHRVAVNDLGFEFMMNALRLTEGFPLALFEERTGLPLAAVLKALDEAEKRGLVKRGLAHAAPTELGRRFLNELLQGFLPEGG
ncbi:MAG: radical SAM family heme chaperone HemW [Sulfurimicrobium sp.]|jgi:oxygen-independent coproporphyrinogen-3 oxidase|nr:radical SAM family heme chaperone HemW [Sulfurimicrobium sp.]MDP1706017.1 radical SAM family heme chaperone HemW [Sulfurimicrobium sp.]MDP2197777.1 radical SAM family heme chaperone HemW [Sulfurimicrobium sp.]MDP2962413.1 radical SAM family heme chaperone HemW [Sulfurimicrobium sp.]MDP3687803.1 radical SAM family heme chaperone HemW [Sulfurimicrobium sp.]